MDKRRILIVDDDKEICNFLREALSLYNYEADTTFNGKMALDMISQNHYGVVIADLAMPEMDGNQLLKEIKKRHPETTVIIMTAYASFENVVNSLKSQAFDFLKKPLPDLEILKNIIENAYHNYEKALSNQNLLGHYELLQKQAMTDSLTNLYNYRYFHERLGEEIKRCQRYENFLCLVFFDVDDFKIINDTYGHQEGDRCLKEVAEILQANVRRSDLVARYGGEEFVIILPETEKEQARILAERVRREVEEKFLGRQLKFTVSGGIAVFPQEADTLNKLIGLADKRLYEAKYLGKNKIIC